MTRRQRHYEPDDQACLTAGLVSLRVIVDDHDSGLQVMTQAQANNLVSWYSRVLHDRLLASPVSHVRLIVETR